MLVEQTHPSVLKVSFDRAKSKGQKLLFIADVHFDNPNCDREQFKRHLDQAKAENAMVVCFGDFFCAMEGKYDPRRSKGTIRPEYNKSNYIDCIVNDAVDFLMPYRDNLLAFTSGNHETAILKNLETDLLDRLVGGLGGGVKKLGYIGYILLRTHYQNANIKTKRVFFHHGHWGGVVTKGTLSIMRYAAISNGADIIVSGHCFDDKTEILTPEGWKDHTQLNEATQVATMNQDTRELEFQNINTIHKYDDYKELYRVKAEGVDLLTTDEHGLILEDYRNGNLIKTTMKDFVNHNEVNILNAAQGFNETEIEVSDEILKLVPWVVSDGSFEGNAIRFHFKKKRKIKRVVDLLNGAGLKFTVSEQKTGTVKIYVNVKSAQRIINEGMIPDKKLSDIYYTASGRQSEIILNEYKYADGNVAKNHDSYVLYSKDKNTLSILQSMCIKTGLKSTLHLDDGSRGCSRLNVSTRSKTMFSKGRYDIEKYEGKVWCVNVNNGTLIVRRNGCVSVTQNTHDAWAVPHAYYDVDGNGELKVREMDVLKCGTYKEEFEKGQGWATEKIVVPKIKRQWLVDLEWNTKELWHAIREAR